MLHVGNLGINVFVKQQKHAEVVARQLSLMVLPVVGVMVWCVNIVLPMEWGLASARLAVLSFALPVLMPISTALVALSKGGLWL